MQKLCISVNNDSTESLIFVFLFYPDSRIWPRASAVGERLWSNPDSTSSMAAERLYRHNERLQLLGIKPEPLAPQYCILNEGQCT